MHATSLDGEPKHWIVYDMQDGVRNAAWCPERRIEYEWCLLCLARPCGGTICWGSEAAGSRPHRAGRGGVGGGRRWLQGAPAGARAPAPRHVVLDSRGALFPPGLPARCIRAPLPCAASSRSQPIEGLQVHELSHESPARVIASLSVSSQ